MTAHFLDTARELIDLRSFSSLWFWIVLATVWGTLSNRVLGVPFDLVRRAAAEGGQPLEDMEALARIHARRLAALGDASGLATVALGAFAATVLALLAFVYRVELAQAVLLIVLPMAAVGRLSLTAARAVPELDAAGIGHLLISLRRRIQIAGLVAIFFSALWGMWVNITHSVL